MFSSGTGPGVITPDGCAVDFYALLSPGREPEIVHAAAPARHVPASILELGAGTGRVTGALAAMGHHVVAVDESPEMLAHITTAETVCSRIEDLDLDRRFDIVLLASHLLNTPEPIRRRAFLAACVRHVAADGCVVIEQHPPSWFDGAAESVHEVDGMVFRLRDLSRPEANLLRATIEYQAVDRVWTQTFTAMRLDDDQLKLALAEAGLTFERYLTQDKAWLRAIPAPGAPA